MAGMRKETATRMTCVPTPRESDTVREAGLS